MSRTHKTKPFFPLFFPFFFSVSFLALALVPIADTFLGLINFLFFLDTSKRVALFLCSSYADAECLHIVGMDPTATASINLCGQWFVGNNK